MAGEEPSPAGLTALQRARAIFGGSAGNLVEWYDWFVYAAFALYFAPAFFPGGDPTVQLIKSAAVFAGGFFARPIGAWLMGVFADRAGRKTALTVSVALMCLGSLATALTPGYARIGPTAPAILAAARLLQGLSVGGEYGASATYLSEMAGRRRRGLWSSFQFVTLIGGQLVALAVLIVLQLLLSPAQLAAWGWRIPFVIGALLAGVVWWIQVSLEETPAFRAARPEKGSLTGALVRAHPREATIVFFLTAGGSLAFYVFTVYMPVFLSETAHFTKAAAARLSAISLVVFLLAQPLYGWLGDRLGRRNLLILAFGLGALTVWPLMTALGAARTPGRALVLVLAALALHAGYTSVSAVVKAELFPTQVRTLGVALPYALANALFGGTAEVVALSLKHAGAESAFFVYVAAVLALAFLAALALPDTNRLGLIVED